jgi:phage terminase small subunit
MRITRTKFPQKDKPKAPIKPLPNDPREVLFVHEYLTDLDMEGAAIRARLVSDRLPQEDRVNQAVSIFNRPSVQSYLREAMEARMARTKVTADRTVRELARMAFVDPIHLVGPDGGVLPMGMIPEATRVCIKEFTQKPVYGEVPGGGRGVIGTEIKVKLHDKLAACTNLMKHLGLLQPDGPSNGLSVNYNQYNVVQGQNGSALPPGNGQAPKIDLAAFSDEELRVLGKMAGADDCDVIDLQQIEAEFYGQ